MTKKSNPLMALLVSCLYLIPVQAQNTISATGGNASGTGGTVSYTVGQVVYTSITGTTGSVTQGVQQPYEISVVTAIDEAKDINLICTVYPNPTTDYLTLKIADYEIKDMSFWLYGVNGNLIVSRKILAAETQISIGDQATGTYFLKITSGKKEIKLFKIIKN